MPPPSWHGVSRRGFLLGAASGLAAGVPLTWLAARRYPHVIPSADPTPPGKPAGAVMPGAYPGRVVEVYYPGAVSCDHVISRQAVSAMIDRGMAELTGYA